MYLVTWSAAIAALATSANPPHWRASAPSERSATDTGESPSVDEPTRTSVTVLRSGAGKAGASLGSRVRLALVVDAEPRPGDRGEPAFTDRLAAHLAGAVAPVVELAEGVLDRVERLLRAFLEGVVELAIEGRGRGVAEVAVARGDEVTELVGDAAGVLTLEEFDGVHQPLLLLEQASAVLRSVDVRHARRVLGMLGRLTPRRSPCQTTECRRPRALPRRHAAPPPTRGLPRARRLPSRSPRTLWCSRGSASSAAARGRPRPRVSAYGSAPRRCRAPPAAASR